MNGIKHVSINFKWQNQENPIHYVIVTYISRTTRYLEFLNKEDRLSLKQEELIVEEQRVSGGVGSWRLIVVDYSYKTVNLKLLH